MTKLFKYIDTTQIDAISGGDLDFKIELVDIFLEQIPEFVSVMKSSLDDKNWELLAREAHTAKSSVLTFGMRNTGVVLKEIQLFAENLQFEKLPELVEKATNDLNVVIPELNELKSSL